MKILLTAGPTHEYLDDVRFLGNPSTGAMGLALAEAARDRGHEVVLVLGPTHLADPTGVRVRRVTSALEMRDAVLEELPGAGAAVMAAAVADYRPERRVPGKIRKGAETLTLELVRNPDVLEDVGRMAAVPVLVGFALETGSDEELIAAARAKLERKRCRLIVANRPGSLGGADGDDVVLVFPDRAVHLGRIAKRSLAERIVRCVEDMGGRRAEGG